MLRVILAIGLSKSQKLLKWRTVILGPISMPYGILPVKIPIGVLHFLVFFNLSVCKISNHLDNLIDPLIYSLQV